MASVELKNVSKIFDKEIKAVDNASLVIEDEEFVVLVGPSGCGKSTLLRMIAGLEEITEGEILIDDQVINNVPPKDRDIAMVFQNYALYPHMSVFENLSFGLKLRKYPKAEIHQRVHEAAEMLSIVELLERKPKALSGGQRQRVALGRALVRKPNVYLFDEPLSNLDAKLRVQMRVEINHLHQRVKTTMVYVTHDQIEAMTLSDKIVVLNLGVIQQVASPLELYNNPVNKFVAGFIGSPAMNLIPGEIINNGATTFKSEHFTVGLNDQISKIMAPRAGKPALLGVRPEHVSVGRAVDERRFSAPQAITVDVVEPVGNEIFVYFSEAGNRYCLRSDPEFAGRPGEQIDIRFDLENLYFFDPDSNERFA